MGCRRKAAVGELFRVVADPTGALVPGAGKPGRGAWLCAGSSVCLENALKRRAFTRALRIPHRADAAEPLRAHFEGR